MEALANPWSVANPFSGGMGAIPVVGFSGDFTFLYVEGKIDLVFAAQKSLVFQIQQYPCGSDISGYLESVMELFAAEPLLSEHRYN